MPRTVNEAFGEFTRKLTPTPGETSAAKNHRASINACLRSHFFLLEFYRTGSFGNGTSVRFHSDVDYMAVLSLGDWNSNSDLTLNRVRNRLRTRFPDSGAERACPAVLVPFGSHRKEDTEVTPAKKSGELRGYAVYQIPNCSGGFQTTSPRLHNDYVASENKRLDNKLKGLIRIIKSWNFENTARVSSFYLELRCTKYMERENSIVYKFDVKTVLCQLRDSGLAHMQDPKSVSGYIPACTSVTAKSLAIAKVRNAAAQAEMARQAEESGYIKKAFFALAKRVWDEVSNVLRVGRSTE